LLLSFVSHFLLLFAVRRTGLHALRVFALRVSALCHSRTYSAYCFNVRHPARSRRIPSLEVCPSMALRVPYIPPSPGFCDYAYGFAQNDAWGRDSAPSRGTTPYSIYYIPVFRSFKHFFITFLLLKNIIPILPPPPPIKFTYLLMRVFYGVKGGKATTAALRVRTYFRLQDSATPHRNDARAHIPPARGFSERVRE
jgi:hypothetical protein